MLAQWLHLIHNKKSVIVVTRAAWQNLLQDGRLAEDYKSSGKDQEDVQLGDSLQA